MSSVVEKPSAVRFSTLEALQSPDRASRLLPYLRFDQLATAAEVIGDLSAAAISVLGAFKICSVLGLGNAVVSTSSLAIVASIVFSVLFVIMLDREGVYRKGSGMLRIRETERTLRVSVFTFLLFFPITFLFPRTFSRWVLGVAFFAVPLVVVIEKQAIFSLIRYLHARGRGVQRVMIYGAGFTGRRVYSALLRSRKLGLNPIALVDDDAKMAGQTLKVLGYHHEQSESVIVGPITVRMIKEYRADLVIVAVPTIGQEKLAELAALAKEAGVTLSFVPNQPPSEAAWVSYEDIDGIMLGTLKGPESMRLYQAMKRVVDICVSATALALLSPLLALIAAGVRLDSEGPVIFKQLRVGKNGKLFEIYKFRTMKTDAQKYDLSPTMSEDSRITRFGRSLRKTSLDELPQLLNVLKGEMSLVGPRPEMPFIVARYGPRELQRLSVIPGITGLWQLSADRAYLIHENPHYDLYYISNRGVFMDIAILLHTLFFAIRGI